MKKILPNLMLGLSALAGLLAAGVDVAAAAEAPVAASAAHLRQVELRIDVTDAVKLPGRSEIAATAFLPDPRRLPARPVVMFALPGGGVTRHYFDLHIDGRERYSEAEYHAADGFIFVAIDHLGVGDSSIAGQDTMHIEDIAQANDAAVREIARRIKAGTLTEGYPALPHIFKVGLGQSMGGGVTIIMQGRHATYDAIAPLGYSAIHTRLPQRSTDETRRVTACQSGQGARWTEPQKLSYAAAGLCKVDMNYALFWDDVAPEIFGTSLAKGVHPGIGGPNWISKTLPNCVIAMLSPGYVAAEAAQITVPVLVAMGERDVVPQPLAEPAAYQSASDVSVVIIPRMGHAENFASTRQILWDRIAAWSRTVAAER